MRRIAVSALLIAAAWYFRTPERRAKFPALARLIDRGR
jgi:hypothetical protein